MSRFLRAPTFVGLGLLAAVLAIGLMASGGLRTTHAQQPLPPSGCIEDLCIGLEPQFATNDVDTDHTVIATVTEAANAVPDEEVSFEVTAGPNSGANGGATTDVNGEASFAYTGVGGAGYDTIQACIDGGELCVEASKEWVAHRMTLEPETATNIVGTEHTVTATVTNLDGTAAPGIDVFIAVWDGPNTPDAYDCDGEKEACVFGPTDASGELTLTYTGDGGVGTDIIDASACIGEDFQCTEWLWAEATKEWVGPTTITLTPKTDLNEVGTKHTVTATVVDSDGRVEGAKVTFTVIGDDSPNKGDTGKGTTDAKGEAAFTYTGDGGADKDTIQACVPDPVTEKDVCDTASKEWTAVVLEVVQQPTPTPTAAALPVAGGAPSEGGSSGLGWLAVIAGGIAVTATGGFWFAYQRRRVR